MYQTLGSKEQDFTIKGNYSEKDVIESNMNKSSLVKGNYKEEIQTNKTFSKTWVSPNSKVDFENNSIIDFDFKFNIGGEVFTLKPEIVNGKKCLLFELDN